MKTALKSLMETSPLYWPLRNWYFRRVYQKQLRSWQSGDMRQSPPHIVKQLTLKAYARAFGLRLFVETGTCIGDMLEAMKRDFDALYSVELHEGLYQRAKTRFRNYNNIVLLHGDSGNLLRKVIVRLDRPTLFWLDGHWSGRHTARGNEDTPILQELQSIFDAEDLGHVIVIDDARSFGRSPGYPSLNELQHYIGIHRPGCVVDVKDDMIRLTTTSSVNSVRRLDSWCRR